MYLCRVFFIVLDLRLTKDWLSVMDSLFLLYSICLIGIKLVTELVNILVKKNSNSINIFLKRKNNEIYKKQTLNNGFI